jgi:hypothetical protein
MAETKTKPTAIPVESFLKNCEDEQMRDDCFALVKLMKKVTGAEAKMWGPSIIGFGQYHYKYDSGHEGDICLAGFAPRQKKIALYVMNFPGRDELLKNFGKHKATKGCLYVKKLDDIDIKVLESLVKQSIDYTKMKYPG